MTFEELLFGKPDEEVETPFPLAGGGAQSNETRMLWDRYNDQPMPANALQPDFLTGNYPMFAQNELLYGDPLSPDDLAARYQSRQGRAEDRRAMRMNEIPASASPYSIYPEELDMHYRAMQELNEQRRRQLMNDVAQYPPPPMPSPTPTLEPDNYGPGWSFQRALHAAGQKIPEWAYAAGNDIRQQVLSDEDLAEIRRDPTSWQSLGAYGIGALNAGIMLSRGAGGKGAGELPKMPVEGKIWKTWPEVGQSKSGAPIVKDHAGNYYETLGTHQSPEGGSHVIVQPVEQPGYVMGPEHNLPVKIDPESLSIHDPSSPHYDQNFTDWFKKVYPEDFDKGGNFVGEGWKPPQQAPEPKPGDPAYQEWQEYKASQEHELDQEQGQIIKDMDSATADYMAKWGTWDDISAADKAKIAKPFGGEMAMDEGDKEAAAKAHFNPQGKAPPLEPPQGIAQNDPAAYQRLWHHPGDPVYPEVPEFAPGDPVKPETPWEKLPPEQKKWYLDQWSKGILPPRTGTRFPPPPENQGGYWDENGFWYPKE